MAREQSEQASGAGAATTIALSLPGAILAGSMLAAVVTWGSTDVTPTMSDGTNTWEEIGTHFWNPAGGILQGFAMFYVKAAAAGSPTITVNFGSSVDFRGLCIAEYSGMDPNPLDASVGNESATAGSGTDNATSTALTPSVDNAVLVGGCALLTASPTMAPGTNYAEIEETPVMGSLAILGMEDRTLASPASVAALWSVTNAADYHARVAAFKPLVATPGSPWVE